MPDGKRDWDQSGRKSGSMRNGSEKLLVGVNPRAAEFENPWRLGALHDPANRIRHIIHIGGLQSGRAAAEHRIDGKLAQEPEDDDEKRVVRTEHHRWTNESCLGERGPDRQFALATLSDVP